MNFKIVIALAFSVLCVLLLLKEAEDMGRKDYHRTTVKMFNRTFLESFDFDRFDLANETSERQLINELQNYFIEKSNSYKFLFCWPLVEIYRDQNEIELDQLKNDWIPHLNASFYAQLLLRNQSAEATKRSLKFFKLFVLDAIRSKNYHVYKYQFCVEVDYYFYLDELQRSFSGLPVYLFMRESYYVHKVVHGHNWFQIWQSREQNLVGGCTEQLTRFGCTNRCFKENSRLSKYFFSSGENGSVYVRFDPQNSVVSLGKHEKACLKRCRLGWCNNHVVSYYYNFSNSATYYDTDVVYSLSRTRYYPLIQPFNFRVQLLGLLLSFAGFSLNQLSFRLLKATCSGIIKNRRFLLALKVISGITWLFIMLALGNKVLSDYQKKLVHPTNSWVKSVHYRPEPISIVVCVSVPYILSEQNRSVYEMSFAELEAATKDAFDRTVSDIYLDAQGQRANVTWELMPDKVFFSKIRTQLARCFQLSEIRIIEPRYQTFLSPSEIMITFHHENYAVYLLVENETLSSRSFEFAGLHRLRRVTKKLLNTTANQCSEYEQLFPTCRTKAVCIDRCVQRKSVERNLSIPQNFVVDKSQFSEEQWSQRFPGIQADQLIEEECRKKFVAKECYMNYYVDLDEESPGTSSEKRAIKIHPTILPYWLFDETPSLYSLVLELLTIESIVFDLNIPQLFTMPLFLSNFSLGLRKKNKLFFVGICIFCLTGFVGHIWMLLSQINLNSFVVSFINEFKVVTEVPEIYLCFDLKDDHPSLDGEQLTGDRLEVITREMRPETVFEQISYLNTQDRWIDLDNRTGFSNDQFNVKTAYYQARKCFKIIQNVQYGRAQFYLRLSEKNVVLRINFNRTFIEKRNPLIFFTTPELAYLDKGNRLHYDQQPHRTYQMSTFSFFFHYFDKFLFISDPLALFYEQNDVNDINKYLNRLKESFRAAYNATTWNLPLESDEFHLNINNSLFRQHYYETQYHRDQRTPENFVYQKESFYYLIDRYDRSEPMNGSVNFEYYFCPFSFSRMGQVKTQEDNLAKIVLNLMNALSLWFNLNLLHTYFFKLHLINFSFLKRKNSKVAPSDGRLLNVKRWWNRKESQKEKERNMVKFEAFKKLADQTTLFGFDQSAPRRSLQLRRSSTIHGFDKFEPSLVRIRGSLS